MRRGHDGLRDEEGAFEVGTVEGIEIGLGALQGLAPKIPALFRRTSTPPVTLCRLGEPEPVPGSPTAPAMATTGPHDRAHARALQHYSRVASLMNTRDPSARSAWPRRSRFLLAPVTMTRSMRADIWISLPHNQSVMMGFGIRPKSAEQSDVLA